MTRRWYIRFNVGASRTVRARVCLATFRFAAGNTLFNIHHIRARAFGFIRLSLKLKMPTVIVPSGAYTPPEYRRSFPLNNKRVDEKIRFAYRIELYTRT